MNGLFDTATLHSVTVPETGWRPPVDFPHLDDAVALALDLETYDPELMTHGPGWGRGVGHIVGVAVGARGRDGSIKTWYFPMRHELPNGMPAPGNFDAGTVLRWVGREFSRPTQPKIGANLEYDTGWLAHEGVTVNGELIDVQYAEPLLDEHRHSYSLDAIATTHLNEHKVDEALYDWLHRAYGGPKGRRQAANIYRAPLALAGPYAEGDVDLPLRIWERQRPQLEVQGLMELFRMECDLIPLYVARRMRGTRIDIKQAEKNRDILRGQEAHLQQEINRLAKFPVNINSSTDLAKLFDAAGTPYPRTEKGNPSFTALFLNACDAPVADKIKQLRAKEKLRSTFLEGALLGMQVNGRIHSQLHPLRNSEGGTVSGRYSSSHPNEQQAPSRSKEGKQLIRGVYLPEEGEEWYSLDYSQVEPRIQFHYARGELVEELRERFVKTPNLNCYREMMRGMGEKAIAAMGGWEDGYKPFKSIWLGLSYEMGIPLMARQLGVTEQQAREWVELFPAYLKELSQRASSAAGKRGYIRTIGGRLARFPFWESTSYDTSRQDGVMPEDEARQKYGNHIKRAWTHKALNRLAQGSSADVIKMAMHRIQADGLPLLINQVHDELSFSLPPGKEGLETAREIQHIMETVVKLKVPLLVDMERGPNWGDLSSID